MKSAIDAHRIDIPCPQCGHKLSETIGKLKTDPKLICPACGTGIEIDAAQMRRDLAGVEQQLADLQRTLRRLGK